ncbi:TIGR02452 family protein [Stackebrandtia nassauensis]|uniref:Microbial-type PARG catalytic domain-containing protein n=1 Tax=Stackebrandtia nassauensis (strain DSM 44728 / CIP 108903 / NRRL B-16338 / NBRC 102104 / LLR-40K-21) TaxID=446470 RepID=D3PWJ2_STANL|nr:TIGR02452 family protein [Stackebrandtia nassauensis]ADD43214.1 conserved hypothetical protein [Stackebrandtia nassauensis DSM 44728]
MSGRLRHIARETVDIAETGEYRNAAGELVDIRDHVADAISGTRHYLPDDHLDVAQSPRSAPTIEVTDETTLTAARRLDTEGNTDTACLVFASAKNPGGGFLGGAKAQEEDLARCSALYRCQTTVPAFYEHHRLTRDLRYSDRVIYSPGVPVFRDEALKLLDAPYRTAFLTAAAPNLGAITRNQPQYVDDVPHALRRRASRVLAVAAAQGHRNLILGAWGCGVFRNDPRQVAEAFAEGLREVDRFDRVVFAVLDNRPQTPVRSAFTEVLAP